MGEVEHVKATVVALDHQAGAGEVDRDHLGSVAVVPVSVIVVAGEMDAVTTQNSCSTLTNNTAWALPQRAGYQSCVLPRSASTL